MTPSGRERLLAKPIPCTPFQVVLNPSTEVPRGGPSSCMYVLYTPPLGPPSRDPRDTSPTRARLPPLCSPSNHPSGRPSENRHHSRNLPQKWRVIRASSSPPAPPRTPPPPTRPMRHPMRPATCDLCDLCALPAPAPGNSGVAVWPAPNPRTTTRRPGTEVPAGGACVYARRTTLLLALPSFLASLAACVGCCAWLYIIGITLHTRTFLVELQHEQDPTASKESVISKKYVV